MFNLYKYIEVMVALENEKLYKLFNVSSDNFEVHFTAMNNEFYFCTMNLCTMIVYGPKNDYCRVIIEIEIL